MELLIERCAGLDVHKASVTATVRIPDQAGGRLQQTRSFRATTAGLVLLGDWLRSVYTSPRHLPSLHVGAEPSATSKLPLRRSACPGDLQ
jgi:hypothetical protein